MPKGRIASPYDHLETRLRPRAGAAESASATLIYGANESVAFVLNQL